MRILITGGLGWTAQSIIELAHEYDHEVVLLDLPTANPDPMMLSFTSTIYKGSIANKHVVQQAAENVDAIVHLAVTTNGEDYNKIEPAFTVNVTGTYNLYESARQNNVNRVILMGSAPVHLADTIETSLSAIQRSPTSSAGDHIYDLTKSLQEHIAKDYADTYGIHTTTLRAGHIVDSKTQLDPKGRHLAEVMYLRGGWVCRYDLARAVIHALAEPLEGYTAYHVISDKRAYEKFEVDKTEQDLKLKFEADFSQFV